MQSMGMRKGVNIPQTVPEVGLWNCPIRLAEDAVGVAQEPGQRECGQEGQVRADASDLILQNGGQQQRAAATLAGAEKGDTVRQYAGLLLGPPDGQQTVQEPVPISAGEPRRRIMEHRPVAVLHQEILTDALGRDVAQGGDVQDVVAVIVDLGVEADAPAVSRQIDEQGAGCFNAGCQ